ncbi:flocculation protein FLO11 isoform X2 [Kryptolebias marmoratus]|nr:flocculation protein FLO11 isoform X2 [Kryptolebias marmoratus]
MYVSLVSKAILWDRGVCHYTVPDRPVHRPSVCPRFLSHMKVRPEDIQPPSLLKSTHQLPSQGKIQSIYPLPFPNTPVLGHLNPVRRSNGEQKVGLIDGRRSAVVAPCLQLPATPPPSSLNSTPPEHNTPHHDSNRQQSKLNTIQTTRTPTSPSNIPPLQTEIAVTVKEKVLRPALVEPDLNPALGPSGSVRSASATSLSMGSFSDFSRQPSSLFSRSTDLASGRSSILSDNTSADIMGSDLQGSVVSLHQLSPVMQLPQASLGPTALNHEGSFKNTASTSTPPLCKSFCDQPKLCSPCPVPSNQPNSDKSLSSRRSSKSAENTNPNTSTDLVFSHFLSPDEEGATLEFPSINSSSRLRPLRTSPRSGLEAVEEKLTPSLPQSRLELHRWPVLPPISPVRGCSAASHCSEISCSQSRMFDELEAVDRLSTSCLSLDQASDSSASTAPDTELSPGLAALTMGCDSGNLGSLSRVQLLLLDRPVPGSLHGLSNLEEAFSPVQEWSDLMMRYDDLEFMPAGHSRPLTACSVSERCDSAGKVRENKSDWSEADLGSPSSWIIDPSPSLDMFGSFDSSYKSNHSTHSLAERPTEEEPSILGMRTSDRGPHSDGESAEGRAEERDPRLEERKTKVLNMLSKLQDNTPRQSKSSKSRSNFEDFDFLAKYCIFSQEKLAEYKRAFEAEDSDGDGYVSCLQVLLALKTIIPPELLSDEEEIYVYRILEMVDFRVTDGLVDLRLFAVIASLAQKIASMDEFMRSLISNMDFRSLEVRLFKAKQLFLFLLEEQREDSGAQQGFISGEQLLLELKAGGIHLDQEAAVRLELQHIPPLDLLDFLAYLPLFMLIHKSVISNPLDDSSRL